MTDTRLLLSLREYPCGIYAAIMFLISWAFTIVSLALVSLIYWYVSIKGKGGDWGDGFKSAYFQLALRSLRSLGGVSLSLSLSLSRIGCLLLNTFSSMVGHLVSDCS
jgi:hypothetical protein